MKCPKCQYISFDDGSKCRNCGYEFSLSIDADTLDRQDDTTTEEPGRFSDFPLEDLDEPPVSVRLSGEPTTSATPLDPMPRPITSSFDLPLFRDRAPDDDRPLVSVPAVPRVPLSVRKAGAAAPAARREERYEPQLDLEPDDAPVVYRTPTGDAEAHAPSRSIAEELVAASPPARLLSAVVDLIILAGIDGVILHLTLKLCGLTYADIGVLPIAPFGAFLLLLNGGYLAAFTVAGGQTIGKMLGRIRVVPSDGHTWSHRVPVGQAVVRTVAWFISALPLGLGFLPALVGADRRALHDRLAHTRVVKA
jgi:uncharacterized RDD family membrane protein YckC